MAAEHRQASNQDSAVAALQRRAPAWFAELRDRAIGHGLKLNEYGLFRTLDGQKIAGDTEEGIYEALGASRRSQCQRRVRDSASASTSEDASPTVC